MSYMDTKFCEICDEDYNWACPECPGCQSRKFWEAFEAKFLAAWAVINALPKCNKCFERPATRHEFFDEYDKICESSYKEHIWRCDVCNTNINELDYAPQLRKWLELNEK